MTLGESSSRAEWTNQQNNVEFEFTHNISHVVNSSIPYTTLRYCLGAGEFGMQSPTEPVPSSVRPPLRRIDRYIKPEIPNLSKRYTIAIIACIGFMISSGIRNNTSILNQKFHTIFRLSVGSAYEVLAMELSFFFAELITVVPGGYLATVYPANRVFGIAIAMSSFINLLMPLAMKIKNPLYVIILMMCQGLVVGVTVPAGYGIWRHWAPPLERSRLTTIPLCGSHFGLAVGKLLSDTLIDWFSWETPFYTYGVMGLIWYVFWLCMCFEKPSLHPTISVKELNYIETSLGAAKNSTAPIIVNTPWKKFFTSMPVYAIMVANFCWSWNFLLLERFLAPYHHSLHFEKYYRHIDILPHLLMTIVVPFGSILADYICKNEIFSTTNVRKIFICGGFGIGATFFLVLALVHTPFAATILLTCGTAFSGFVISGFNVNYLDIAPRYSSILAGISIGIGKIAGFLCGIVVYIIFIHMIRQSWSDIYILAAVLFIIGAVFYWMFASGELQPWAEPKMDDHQLDEVSNEKEVQSSYGTVEQLSKGLINNDFDVKSSLPEPKPSNNNLTNSFLTQPTNTLAFAE